MAIKQDADAAYFLDNRDERDLANRLDEAFDITYGRKRGQLSFWLADPKPHTRARFGLTQEILVVYSTHASTDARVLTAFEHLTRDPEFKYRVERLLFLLVHNGDIEGTSQLVSSQADRIVVPFQADELRNPQRGSVFISSRIAQTIGQMNLFGMSSPIKTDKYFFGRNELVQTLIARAISRGENSGLFGLRKTGKTSVLFAVQRRTSEQPILCEYIDCQNPGTHGARWWQLLENIVARCSSRLQREHKRTASVRASLEGVYKQDDAGRLFALDVAALLADGQLSQIVLMLDEIEYITRGLSGAFGKHWDDDFIPFWQTIRAVHQETLGKISFIVAGVNPASVMSSHFDTFPNPIFQLADPQFLEPLTEEDVRKMVRSIGRYAGLKFEEETYRYLSDTYGGHPYLIRIACSEIWAINDITNPERMFTVSTDAFHQLRFQIKARLSQPIKDILLSLVWWYPDEYDLLRILAASDDGAGFVTDYIKTYPESVVQFVRYGVLKPSATGFAIADLRDFLQNYGDDYNKELSPFLRGDMPAELLPEVPDLELLGQLFQKRTEVEVRLRKAIALILAYRYSFDPTKIATAILKGLPPQRDRREPKELFVGRTYQSVLNELFTRDLKEIIHKNWEEFAAVFDNKKTWFEMNMDTLNKARRVDAHSKPVTKDEASEFLTSYSWLLSKLAKIPD